MGGVTRANTPVVGELAIAYIVRLCAALKSQLELATGSYIPLRRPID
jgi:hypothetical protein